MRRKPRAGRLKATSPARFRTCNFGVVYIDVWGSEVLGGPMDHLSTKKGKAPESLAEVRE
jgi:hypothetical protein